MENREVSCCFSGHRIIPAAEYDNVSYQLELKVIDLIGQGVSRRQWGQLREILGGVKFPWS